MSSKIIENQKSGYIKLFRSIRENWIFGRKPYSQLHAFIDLLMEAEYENRDVEVGNTIITVKRGQIYRSIRDWATRWGWHRSRVHRYLQKLEFQSVILRKNVKKQDMITVVNYDDYQNRRDVPETILRQSRDNPETVHSLLEKSLNNDNNDNQIDKRYPLINNNIYISPLLALFREWNLDDDRTKKIVETIKDDEEIAVLYLEKVKSIISVIRSKGNKIKSPKLYFATSIDNFNPKTDKKTRKIARKIIRENEKRKKMLDAVTKEDQEREELRKHNPDKYYEFLNSGMSWTQYKTERLT